MDKNVQPHQYSPSSSHELPMEPRAKVVPVRVSIVSVLTFRKTEIVTSARGRKLQGLLAEDVLVQSWPNAENFGDLIISEITKFSVKGVNHDIIIDTLCCGTRLGNSVDYNPTHVKHKLLRRPKRACKSSWSRPGNQKSFTLTFPWNMAKLVEN